MTDRLRGRWRERERVVVLDAGPGSVRGFIAAWDAWRREDVGRGRLHFIAIEPRAITADEVHALGVKDLAKRLADVWPPMTPNLHRLSFEGGRVQVVLALGDVLEVLPELVCEVDFFRLRSRDATWIDATSMTAHFGLHPGYESGQRRRIL